MSERGDQADDDAQLVRSEEDLDVGTEWRDGGGARVRKVVESETVDALVPRGVEHADVDRQPGGPEDSGEIEQLPDGSISIPVFEEQLVIERRMVVRERIIVRTHVVTEQKRVEAELRRERVEVDVEDVDGDTVHVDAPHADARHADADRDG